MSRLAMVEDLLDRSLAVLRADLVGFVHDGSNLDRDGAGEFVPRPGTLCREMLAFVEPRLALVREIEAAIGRFEDHPEPQWLDDLIDGKWSLI